MKRMTNSELEDYIRQVDAAAYARNRNYIDGSTRLSEYITRGAISLPRVRELLLVNNSASSAYKLINELAWREYWQLTWDVKGDAIFEYIRPLPREPRQGIPTAVLQAQTGIAALDAGIRQLQDTGYIHNHMRMWLAGLITNVARCDWKYGADWMHSYLIDGDYASNHLSWQWVAGSYTGKPYLPQQQNINTYAHTVQHNSFLDKSYEEINDMPIPAELMDSTQDRTVHVTQPIVSTVTLDQLQSASGILLYSPWTLDPSWRPDSAAHRVLLIDSDMYKRGSFSQQVIDSITWFAGRIPGLLILYDRPAALQSLSSQITRRHYPGIAKWPGKVDTADRLFPQVPHQFYPSFSAYWKQAQKTQ